MKRLVLLSVATMVAVAALGVAPAAMAGTQARVSQGPCSVTSTWMLTLKYDNGRVESDVEVQTPQAGQTWHFVMKDNGVKFGSGHRISDADGSWDATRFATNQPSTDAIVVKAKNLTTGEICKADGTIG
jgi:hypothetical protein